MFAAIDAGDVAKTNAIDSDEVDPIFGEIGEQISGAAAASRANSDQHLHDLAVIQARVLFSTPLVFTFGLGLVVFFWRVLVSYQDQVKRAVEREAEAARRNEQRFRALVQNASDLVLICSPDGTVFYQSPATHGPWGYTDDALLDEAFTGLVHPEDTAAARDLWDQTQAVRGATKAVELRCQNAAGAWRHAELILSNLLDEPAVNGLIATVHDIQDRKIFEQQLTQQAFYDGLTGLPNRALLCDRIKQALVRTGRRNTNVGLLFLDLDKFKIINDSLGHQTGDELLIEVATRLKASVRAEDTVGRLGGDEFVVLLENIADDVSVLPVVEAIKKQFGRSFLLEGREIAVTASIGIAFGDASRDQADSLLRNADLAMYRAKAAGKGRHVIFDSSMQVDTLARLELENDLRAAIDGGQLRVHYQPIVPLKSERVTEVEALVRWQHPTQGMISPLDFIPLAEETGLIIPLGLWVLKEACRQAAIWHAQFPIDPPVVISVNLSPRQFQMPDLAEEVERTLQEAGLPARYLKLEITEGTIMLDVEATISTLSRLKAIGIKLAVDDFGTGYSSLAYLKRLPLDVLKIDRSFIKGIAENAEDKAIVQAILLLAKSLNLEVTAEGIENAEQAAMLNSWQCERGQGYYFARPMEADKATALLGRLGLSPLPRVA
ncbi:putative bifunctional diguanylate cyclase/phosphodiesterase [Lichenifustis flavocetrariae]|uniref:EAL domain-containing protein n=1 Tax=Lichenifustis flavocetrariae TaxID=2949735 RepID=A0AA41Z8F7_9HYPH|nr:EAL domain-containing protein [Lichenifustis flavocetrariae]MCW6512428.1 EAL domain-containing protein [Lichenifustis flavocetrariae]